MSESTDTKLCVVSGKDELNGRAQLSAQQILQRFEAAKLHAMPVNAHEVIAWLDIYVAVSLMTLQHAMLIHHIRCVEHNERGLLCNVDTYVATLPTV